MTPFNEYTRYYDLFYRDKDYVAEVTFVEGMIRTHHPSALSVLEFGCGTGRHAEFLVQRGFKLHGVDRSEGMLKEALSRKALLSAAQYAALDFSEGDIRNIRLGRRFDAVISLFHVMSYQTKNEDLEAAFATARAHLDVGGIFIFDYWYGPAVLSEMPEVRIKRLSENDIEVTRIAMPVLNPQENCVTVNYEVNIIRKTDQAFSRFSESHDMRYFFLPEIYGLLERHGMKPIFSCEWMSGKNPGLDTWNVCTGGAVIG